MNLKKIKYLFIIGFLLLNGFLLYILLDQDREQSQLADGQGRITNNALSENINPKFELTDEVQELPMRSAHRDRLSATDNVNGEVEDLSVSEDGYRLTGNLKSPIPLSGTDTNNPYLLKSADQNRLSEWLGAGNIPYADDFVFAFYDQSQKQVYFGQKIDGEYLFLDSTAELIFHVDDDARITSFEMTHVSNVKSEGPNQRMVTTKQAINNLSISGRFVQDMTLYQAMSGYQDMFTVNDIVVYRPIWLLLGAEKDGNLDQFYVDGVKGNIVRNENDPNEQATAAVEEIE
ncbi:MAG: two-component system regulatory protein YycI [Aerococcus sp.]|nr:two-component system regulatory protein YycI [Aerococcus sp.]